MAGFAKATGIISVANPISSVNSIKGALQILNDFSRIFHCYTGGIQQTMKEKKGEKKLL